MNPIQNIRLYFGTRKLFIKPTMEKDKDSTKYTINTDKLNIQVTRENLDNVSRGFKMCTATVKDNNTIPGVPQNGQTMGWAAKQIFKRYDNGIKLNLVEKYNIYKQVEKSDAKIYESSVIGETEYGDAYTIKLGNFSVKTYVLAPMGNNEIKKHSISILDNNNKEIYTKSSRYAKRMYKLMHEKYLMRVKKYDIDYQYGRGGN